MRPAYGCAWTVHDAKNGTTLPGDLVRSAGDPEVADVAVNEAATGMAETLALFTDYGRSSYDDRGATVVASVHYEKDYDNAFWDGTQLVFGDGDGKVFGRFTKPIDVLGHELSHAVTQFTANLTYQGQSGALNESMSDVFGACVKQRHLKQTAASADWLVGEGIFVAGINGKALRSMESPGTAYDDPQLGKDPQVGDFKDYVDTTDDNGGVHLNSGIPNRAFVLAAKAVGGESWSGAGKIWYAALTSGLSADSDGRRRRCARRRGHHGLDDGRRDTGCRGGPDAGAGARGHDGPGRPERRLRRAPQGGPGRPRLRRPPRPRGPTPDPAGRPPRGRRRASAARPVRLPLPLPRLRDPGPRARPHPRPRPARPDRPRRLSRRRVGPAALTGCGA